MYSKLYNYLSTPEDSGKKIGLFRTVCSILGGLVLTYLAMTFLVIVTPLPLGDSMLVPLYLGTFIWSIVAFWISLSYTKLIALKRVLIPSSIFAIVIIIHMLGV
ncbi:hypothetical protein CRV02_07305 [Arcobacter sp. CECT 8989]|uniref:hypothetical protein n=1 Tax=Arcobacter sp. CECT 8989 TaxID=2044509 RepID=UPI00100A6103|nr:hypothetical protein [Arcobacter sp. CECT 8989]RXK01680.1 hypothetical protein CRV02_07305 [Arcobacter sp. CECT 8989]